MTLVLNNGLVVIEKFTFTYCISLEYIVIPPTFTEIKEGAFLECMQLSLVILQNGHEVIESCAFSDTSIKSIKIPPSVTDIWDDAFEHYSNLTHVVFCDVIKKKCIQNADDVLVESRCPQKVLKYLLLSRPR